MFIFFKAANLHVYDSIPIQPFFFFILHAAFKHGSISNYTATDTTTVARLTRNKSWAIAAHHDREEYKWREWKTEKPAESLSLHLQMTDWSKSVEQS